MTPDAPGSTDGSVRGRSRLGRPVLSRATIGRAVLDLTAAAGPDAVTMRALATHLEVTPRALYKVVDDRSDALVAASVLAQSEWELPELRPAHWADDLAALCRTTRAWYRRYPGLLRLAASADVTAEVHPRALLNNEAAFGFLLGAGLSPADALRGWDLVIGTLAGFAELESWRDGSARHADAAHADDTWAPTPQRLLDQHADLDLPHTRRVAAVAGGDTLFEDTVEMLVDWVGRRRG